MLPNAEEFVPALQGVHEVEPGVAYLPGSHCTHAADELEPAGATDPPGQGMGLGVLTVGQKVPAGHWVQPVAEVACWLQYDPAVHARSKKE